MDLFDIPDGPIMPAAPAPATPAATPATPAAPPAAETPAAPAAPVVAPEAPSSAQGAEVDNGDEPIVPGAPAAAAAPAPVELSDDAEVKIGGHTYKVKELMDERLMRADYSRKTTELARERDAMDDFRLEVDLERTQTQDFLHRVSTNPTELINEFAEHMPDVWAQVEDHLIERAIHLQSLSPEGRELFLHKERQARAAWRAQRDQRMEGVFRNKRSTVAARKEAAKSHKEWREGSMRSAGLDPTNDAHHDLVMEGMASPRNRGKAWTKEMFDAESARIAKIIGAKAPPPPTAAAAAAPATPAAPPLPPVRAAHAAAARPVEPKVEVRRDARGRFKQNGKSSEDAWAELRESGWR